MEKSTACCGCICNECGYYPDTCRGCAAIQGKPFWLEYTGDEKCGIYKCCIEERKLPHCGQCPELPCEQYELQDPTKTPEENAEDRRQMLKVLYSLK